MSDTPIKLVFHRDRFGAHIFYPSMNSDAVHKLRHSNVKINGIKDFNMSETIVVPAVERVSSVESENQTIGYLNSETGERMSVSQFRGMVNTLQVAIKAAQNVNNTEEEVRKEVELRTLQGQWHEEKEEVEKHTDHEFEIVDIDYPSDDRLTPLRHFDDEKINYFKVDGKKVATRFMHELAAAEGLTHEDGHKRGTYYVREGSLYSPPSIKLEGRTYDENLGQVRLSNFEGPAIECREYIKSIEIAIRKDFDLWKITHRQPDHITVGFVERSLKSILRAVEGIDSKKRTDDVKTRAVQTIHKVIAEIREFGLSEINSEETSEEEVDILSN